MTVSVNEAVSGITQGGGGGGGGGFAAQATQTSDTGGLDNVSITSVAGVGNFINSYKLNSITDNTEQGLTQFELLSGTDNTSNKGEIVLSSGDGVAVSTRLLLEANQGSTNGLAILDVNAINETTSLSLSGATCEISIDLGSIFSLAAPSQTGADTASFVNANAPVAGLTITNWIAVTLNGVQGYIPFLS